MAFNSRPMKQIQIQVHYCKEAKARKTQAVSHITPIVKNREKRMLASCCLFVSWKSGMSQSTGLVGMRAIVRLQVRLNYP